MPSTHRRRRRDSAVEMSRVGASDLLYSKWKISNSNRLLVGALGARGVYTVHISQLVGDSLDRVPVDSPLSRSAPGRSAPRPPQRDRSAPSSETTFRPRYWVVPPQHPISSGGAKLRPVKA